MRVLRVKNSTPSSNNVTKRHWSKCEPLPERSLQISEEPLQAWEVAVVDVEGDQYALGLPENRVSRGESIGARIVAVIPRIP
jgi:hypothetical protein